MIDELYKILEVTPNATTKEIQIAYKKITTQISSRQK